jgi:hypothetical protein
MLTLKLEFEKLRNEIYLFLYNQDNPFIYIYRGGDRGRLTGTPLLQGKKNFSLF